MTLWRTQKAVLSDSLWSSQLCINEAIQMCVWRLPHRVSRLRALTGWCTTIAEADKSCGGVPRLSEAVEVKRCIQLAGFTAVCRCLWYDRCSSYQTSAHECAMDVGQGSRESVLSAQTRSCGPSSVLDTRVTVFLTSHEQSQLTAVSYSKYSDTNVVSFCHILLIPN